MDVDAGGQGRRLTSNRAARRDLNDRPPLMLRAAIQLAGQALYAVTVIVNHLRSLSGVDDPADGERVRVKRRAQAEYLANLIQSRQAAIRRAHRLGRRLQRVPVQRRLRRRHRDDQRNADSGEPGGARQCRPRESRFEGSRRRRAGDPSVTRSRSTGTPRNWTTCWSRPVRRTV